MVGGGGEGGWAGGLVGVLVALNCSSTAIFDFVISSKMISFFFLQFGRKEKAITRCRKTGKM